jgi:hypothetical protein
VLAGLSGVLAAAGIPIFALSTHDTDYVLVPMSEVDRARYALALAGYRLRPGPGEPAGARRAQ